MENNDITEENLADIFETIPNIDESNQQHNDLAFYDMHIFDNTDISSMLPVNVNNLGFQNQNIEEINDNNICDGNIFTSMMNIYQDGQIADNETFQPMTTISSFHESQSQIQYLVSNEFKQIDRLNNVYEKYREHLHINEDRLIRRNVPRLMIISSDYEICFINCTLHMLLNAPVFIRLIRKLQKISEENITNLQSIQNISHIDNDINAKRELFCNLSNIIKMIFEEKQNVNIEIPELLQSLRVKYQKLYSHINDWNEQDPDKFYINWMNILQLVANEMNQMELYSKAFEITSFVINNDEEHEKKKDYLIRFLPNHNDFKQYIDKNYTGVVADHTHGNIIDRKYELLPKQLLAACESQQNEYYVPYPYPTEFVTSCNQRYLFTGAIIRNSISFNCNHYSLLIRRQDCVYLINNYRLVDRFHIDYLPIFFNTVSGRALLYTEVDPCGEYVCTFEDPLCAIKADKPTNESPCYCERENLLTSTPSQIVKRSTDVPSVIIRHPISSTFRYYYHSDFENNINPDIPKLSDCLNGNPLYLCPRSIFAGCYIECTLVFKDPDGNFYRSHYEFVFNEHTGKRFENPTYIYIDENNVSDDKWFPLKLTISKPKQDALEAKDVCKNKTVRDNQHSDICELVRYPNDKKEKIDQEKLLSFTKDQNKKKTSCSKRGPKKNSQKVTPHKLSQVIDLNKLCLAIRQARWLSDEKKYVPVSDNLFYSNFFKPVSSSIKKCNYKYDADLLQITELTPSKIKLSDENDICTIYLSYLIPDMYKCTSLKDKYIQIIILTGDDKDPRVHPVYQFLDKENRVSSMIFSANEYSSTLSINIVKNALNAFQNDFKMRQTLVDSIQIKQTTPIVMDDSLYKIYTSPSMTNFHLKLQLCYLSNGDIIPYPKSIILSNIIRSENISQEKQLLPKQLKIDNEESNDIVINDPLSHMKRSFDEEINISSEIKCPKLQ